MMPLERQKRLVVSKNVEGEDALLYNNGEEYGVFPEERDFEPVLARDISEKNENFILKGKVVNKTFVATDVVFHGEFMANKPWRDRYLELKKKFSYRPSVRMSGAIVVEDSQDAIDAAKSFSVSPLFDGVYIEGYNSDMYDERLFISKKELEEFE